MYRLNAHILGALKPGLPERGLMRFGAGMCGAVHHADTAVIWCVAATFWLEKLMVSSLGMRSLANCRRSAWLSISTTRAAPLKNAQCAASVPTAGAARHHAEGLDATVTPNAAQPLQPPLPRLLAASSGHANRSDGRSHSMQQSNCSTESSALKEEPDLAQRPRVPLQSPLPPSMHLVTGDKEKPDLARSPRSPRGRPC